MAAERSEVVDRVARELRARGERMTGPRRAVLMALLSSDGHHLGSDEVVEAVATIDSSVHRASVFRALAALTHAGAVQHVHEGHGSTVYHLSRDPHVHAQCSRCGVLIDVRPDLLDEAAATLRDETGFVLDPGHVALSGRCRDCA